MTVHKLRWGILSTGKIAHTFARSLAVSDSGELTAVASRTPGAAASFAAEFGITRAHGSYEALLADPEVEVVYIATPHPWHAHWSIAAARAKKHVLCEKPLGMNHAEVSAIVQAARENDVFLMEAFMYRCQPQTREVLRLLRSGALGRVKGIYASFGIDGAYSPSHRVLNRELGGGGLLDVGCYPVSMARLVAGAACGESFAEPLELHAVGHVGEASQVDEYTSAVLKFPGEIMASLSTGVQLWQDNSVRIFGSEGRMHLRTPWHPAHESDFSEIVIERPKQEVEVIRIAAPGTLYSYEIDAVRAQLEQRQAVEMSWADSLGNALTLDRWRRALGVTFAADSAST
ncbi:MAG TPA: Gfo/Idh/MocA family oxidoreductase [Polyangiaceae bacterium]|nr:Gfo/Idh/MocA family oxidoreductase [Polyangiaceae bacterium]